MAEGFHQPNIFRAYAKNSTEIEYKRKREGDKLFIVQARSSSWIPLHCLIFSDTAENAIKAMKDGIAFVLNNSSKERKNHIRSMLDLEFECQEGDKDMMYKTEWASNAGPF